MINNKLVIYIFFYYKELPISNLLKMQITTKFEQKDIKPVNERIELLRNTKSKLKISWSNVFSRIQELSTYDKQLDELYKQSFHLAEFANRKASIYKFFHYFCSLLVILAGAAITILSLKENIDNYYLTALGICVVALKSIIEFFSLQSKAYVLKKASNKLYQIARESKSLKTSGLSDVELCDKLKNYFYQVDELDLNIFGFTETEARESIIKN